MGCISFTNQKIDPRVTILCRKVTWRSDFHGVRILYDTSRNLTARPYALRKPVKSCHSGPCTQQRKALHQLPFQEKLPNHLQLQSHFPSRGTTQKKVCLLIQVWGRGMKRREGRTIRSLFSGLPQLTWIRGDGGGVDVQGGWRMKEEEGL